MLFLTISSEKLLLTGISEKTDSRFAQIPDDSSNAFPEFPTSTLYSMLSFSGMNVRDTLTRPLPTSVTICFCPGAKNTAEPLLRDMLLPSSVMYEFCPFSIKCASKNVWRCIFLLISPGLSPAAKEFIQ